MSATRLAETPAVANPEPLAAAWRLCDLISASWVSQAVSAASELRIADLPANGPRCATLLHPAALPAPTRRNTTNG
jgi:hypothetical protein